MEKHDGRDTGEARFDDPWYDALGSGWGELDGTGAPAPAVPSARPEHEGRTGGTADVYLEVQRSAAFQEVRGRYRRFVVPGVAVFFTWYVSYVVTATTAPGFMARPVMRRGERGDGGGARAVPQHVSVHVGVRAACAAAQGPGRAGSALGHPGADPERQRW